MKTKEAIERVRSRFDKWALDNEDLTALQTLGLIDIESEDERIRKMLIHYFSDDDTTNGISNSSIRAYLEKQKEQKPTKWDDKDLPQGGESVMINRILHSLKLYREMLKDSDFEEDYIKTTLNDCLEDEKWLISLETSQNSTEWSEEDETAYGDLIWCIEQARKSAKDENDMGNI